MSELTHGPLDYQACSACGHVWWFSRTFCPRCGCSEVQERTSGGAGCICASTVVYRAPSDEFKPLVPYAIVLVDLDDGPRVMGHAAAGLTVGARVRGESRQIVGRAIAYFSDVAK